ncbi:DgyrCDS6566 [Dimorphilus gyrociliatus]|uniref:DgyrCDS6566 n=1 Tax=Dimorphilus gyrociliatus TaxID=2664684 RepID=A0A7I8VP26_9ANNE|nr:DgyrCDS6566 [Dimorphilus gyrociliatus]
MTTCRHDIAERALSKLFRKYAVLVSNYTLPFILVPLVITGICGAGLYRLEKESDSEYLYTPQNSLAKTERDKIGKLFPQADSVYDSLRATYLGSYAGLIINHKNRDNLYTRQNIEYIMKINKQVRAFKTKDGKTSYDDVCEERNGDCMQNSFLTAILDDDSSNVNKFPITYPIYELDIGGGNDSVNINLSPEIGGVTTNNNRQITKIEAIELRFFVSNSEDCNCDAWLASFLDNVDGINHPDLILHKVTSNTIEDELSRSATAVVSKFSILFTLLISFSIITQIWYGDSVRSKPFLALAGVASSGLAIVTGFGLMCWIGVKFIDLVLTCPFLAISIGCDDMFVLIAAWRTTDQKKSTSERLKSTFEEGGVSITITVNSTTISSDANLLFSQTLTDVLAITIGTISSFRSVQIFCGYLAVVLLFDFIYQITFFAGFMVYEGRREEKNGHFLTLRPVLSKSECIEQEKSTSYSIFCKGGISQAERDSQIDNNEKFAIDNKPHFASEFFKTKFAPFINHPFVRINTLILYIAYLGGTIYGCTRVDLGMELSRLAPDNSYVISYYAEQNRYFKKYFYSVSIAIEEEIDYLNLNNIKEINNVRQNLKNLENVHDEYLGNDWLLDFERFKTKHNIVINSQDALYNVLKNQFLNQPAYRAYNLDIAFSNKRILASRFWVTTKDSGPSTTQVELMKDARKITENAKLKMFSFAALYPIIEQYVAVLPNTLQNIGIATATMLVISLVLIPDVFTIIWVTLSIASICAGVIGFMAFWSVNIDTISMINLVMCIGFSVDFTAHTSYAFVKSSGETNLEKMQHAFEKIAFPVLLGGLSTILGLMGMAATNVYIFRVFFKTMLLVMLFGLLHGLLFLPTIMITLNGLCKKRGRSPRVSNSEIKA